MGTLRIGTKKNFVIEVIHNKAIVFNTFLKKTKNKLIKLINIYKILDSELKCIDTSKHSYFQVDDYA